MSNQEIVDMLRGPWFRRGTTPTFEIDLGIDISLLDIVHITFAQDDKVLVVKELEELRLDENNPTTVYLTMTQDETLRFEAGVCTAQTRVVFKYKVGGIKPADSTDLVRLKVLEVIEGGVLEK